MVTQNQQPHVTRDERILAHLGLYRITLRSVLARRFFGGRTPGNVVQRLMNEGRITSRRGLDGNLRYYQLTANEVNRRGLPLNRAKPFGPQAIHTHLAVLWYCLMLEGPQKRRLEDAELASVFDQNPPSGIHCGEPTDPPRLVRVFAPNPCTRASALARRLSERLEETSRHPTIRELLGSRQYAVVILVQGHALHDRLRNTLTRYERPGTIPAEVSLVPSASALAAAARTRAT